MSNGLNYVTAHGSESFGAHGAFGIRIDIACGRELTAEDRYALYDAERAIAKAIRTQTMKLDPKEKERADAERKELVGLFQDPIYVKEIPNQYCSDWCCSQRPWYDVTTRFGVVTIGWRKRVIEIEWKRSDIQPIAEELFPNSTSTREGKLIHAWSLDDARTIVSRLYEEHEKAGAK